MLIERFDRIYRVQGCIGNANKEFILCLFSYPSAVVAAETVPYKWTELVTRSLLQFCFQFTLLSRSFYWPCWIIFVCRWYSTLAFHSDHLISAFKINRLATFSMCINLISINNFMTFVIQDRNGNCVILLDVSASL